jgi:flagellar basal body-associated protein FliL
MPQVEHETKSLSEDSMQIGVTAMEEIAPPYLNKPLDDADEETLIGDDQEQSKKGFFPVLIIIAIAVILLGGMGVTAVYFLGGVDSKTTISLANETFPIEPEPSIKPVVDIPKVSAPPALPVIKKTQIDYQIAEEESTSISKEQFNQLMTALDVMNTKLNKLELAIGNDSSTLQNLGISFESLNEKSDALIATSELIAGQVTKQVTQVETVKKLVFDESERKVRSANQPPFRVAGKSVWGNTVYLTIATEDKFEQQATIGATIAGWTLRKVDLKKKLSTFQNAKGDEYVLDIP